MHNKTPSFTSYQVYSVAKRRAKSIKCIDYVWGKSIDKPGKVWEPSIRQRAGWCALSPKLLPFPGHQLSAISLPISWNLTCERQPRLTYKRNQLEIRRQIIFQTSYLAQKTFDELYVACLMLYGWCKTCCAEIIMIDKRHTNWWPIGGDWRWFE